MRNTTSASSSRPGPPPTGAPVPPPLTGSERALALAILRGRLAEPARLEPRDLAVMAALHPRLARSGLGRPASALLATALVLLRDGPRNDRIGVPPERLRRVVRRALRVGRAGHDPWRGGETASERAWFARQARLAAELLLSLPLALFAVPTLAPLAEALAPRLGHRADPDLVEVLWDPAPEDDDEDAGIEDGGGAAFGRSP